MSYGGTAPNWLQKTLHYDVEYDKWRSPLGDKTRMAPCEIALEFRQFIDPFMNAVWASLPPQPTVHSIHYDVIVSHDGLTISVRRFGTTEQLSGPETPEAASSILAPALLYVHGGGMVAVSVYIVAPQMRQLAALSGVQVFAVAYRLASEHPAPTPAEDVYAALSWMHARAADLGIHRARIGVIGDSAGCGLAAATALMARDQGLNPPLKRLILVYPMLDDRAAAKLLSDFASAAATGEPPPPLIGFATFPLQSIRVRWRAYLGLGAGHDNAEFSPYAAPGRVSDLRGLPASYLGVGELDLFRDECVSFAQRLAAANVEVEFHLLPGLPRRLGLRGALWRAGFGGFVDYEGE
ncbi:alpha/beta hydrolase fold-domain-containing protein [Xylariaceae sp. FL0255]|nr:alpha/beta hydrolase fold-domain-containing protein [Xylariaceae sp. FL0255]